MEQNLKNPLVIAIGVEDSITSKLKTMFKDVKITLLNDKDRYFDEIENCDEHDIVCCLVGTMMGIDYQFEISQTISNFFPTIEIAFVTTKNELLEKSKLEKNGFTKVFLFPIDMQVCFDFINQCLTYFNSDVKNYKIINLIDIKPNLTLDFELYLFLPVNNKIFKITNKGEPISEKHYNNIMKNDSVKLMIKASDIDQYFQYTSDKIRQLKENKLEISEVERQSKLEGCVRNLLLSLFDSDGNSKEALAQSKAVISSLISGGATNDWTVTFKSILGKLPGFYSSTASVSTIAALVGYGIDYSEPEDLAIAAFFHDFSIWNLNLSVNYYYPFEDKLEPVVKEKYYNHPEESAKLLDEKNMIVSEDIYRIIEEHHEKADGTGFPKKLTEKEIHLGAQILCFADQLDHLTSLRQGKEALKFEDAVDTIFANGSLSNQLIDKLKKLLNQT